MQYLSNERVKELAKLRLKKFRDEKKSVIVEGIRIVQQLIIDGIPIAEMYCNEKSIEKYLSFEKDTAGFFLAKEHQINRLSDSKSSQDILALVEIKSPEFSGTERLLYLDRISEPGNIGAIFRTAKAAGIEGIILSPGCCDIFNPKTVRASVGTVFSVPGIIRDYDYLDRLDNELIVTDANEGSSLYSLDSEKKPYVLIIGSEANGIDRELIRRAHKKVRIPMLKKLESLNVAVAAGLCIYQLNRDILGQ